jgi:hypothetical protein
VFNVPAYVTASLMKGNGSVSKSNLLIAQLGNTSRLTHKVSKLSIELDPSTGEIKKMSGQNTAVGPDAVKKSGETINNTISTFKKEKETELEALTKERQILEEKKKIMDLKKQSRNNQRSQFTTRLNAQVSPPIGSMCPRRRSVLIDHVAFTFACTTNAVRTPRRR